MFHGTHSSRYGMVIALLNFQYPHLHKNFKMLGPINILLWREKRLFNEAPPLSWGIRGGCWLLGEGGTFLNGVDTDKFSCSSK